MNHRNQPDPLLNTERVVFYFLGVDIRGGEGGISPCSRIRMGVEIPQGQPLKTSAYPGVAQRVLERYPEMARHRCSNGRGLGVGQEFFDTEIAHLAEHVLIEELVAEGADRSQLRGETLWRFETTGWGRYTVRVDGVPCGLDHRQVALRAVRSTASMLEDEA